MTLIIFIKLFILFNVLFCQTFSLQRNRTDKIYTKKLLALIKIAEKQNEKKMSFITFKKWNPEINSFQHETIRT